MVKEKQDTLFVGSLEKGMRVLAAFTPQRPEMGLTELADCTGLDKSAAQRLTNTLHKTGYLDKDPETRRFRLSLKCLELASAYLCGDPLPQLAMPKLVDLSRHLGERINAARLDGTDIVYVIRIPTQLTSFSATLIGRRVPALNTSSGRILLAHMAPEARRQAIADWPIHPWTPRTTHDRAEIAAEVAQAAAQGFGLTVNQNLMNEIAIAAPLFNTAGQAVAAVQCSVSSLKWSVERVVADIAPLLTEVAGSIQLPR